MCIVEVLECGMVILIFENDKEKDNYALNFLFAYFHNTQNQNI